MGNKQISERINDRNSREHIRYRYSAKDWESEIKYYEREMLDSIMQKLFDKDIEFSEERQSEIELTMRELLINSVAACKERADLFIDLDVYYSDTELLMRVVDDGPGFNHREKIRERRETFKYMGIREFLEVLGTSHDYKNGVGLYCLIHYTKDFKFNEKGNEVTARFKF